MKCSKSRAHMLITNVDTLLLFAFAVCEKQTADLVFLLDHSGSIHPKDYATMKNFTISLINSFRVGEEHVRIGLAQFNDSFEHQFYLNQFYSEENISKHILDMKQKGGGTHIGGALESIQKYFTTARGSRIDSGLTQNLVLITDGESQDDVEEAAHQLKALGIEVFAIGIGNVHDLELLQITGTPERLFTVQDFSVLEKIKQKVVDTICESKPSTDPSKSTNVTLPSCSSLFCSHNRPLSVKCNSVSLFYRLQH